MSTNQIIWHQLANESANERTTRLNAELHRIFFDGKEVCPAEYLEEAGFEDGPYCHCCRTCFGYSGKPYEHSTPRFLESLDAMQLIVTSGKFAEVREEFFHWLSKERYECVIFLYGQIGSGVYFRKKGNSRQEAFYGAALTSQGYEVVQEEQGEDR